MTRCEPHSLENCVVCSEEAKEKETGGWFLLDYRSAHQLTYAHPVHGPFVFAWKVRVKPGRKQKSRKRKVTTWFWPDWQKKKKDRVKHEWDLSGRGVDASTSAVEMLKVGNQLLKEGFFEGVRDKHKHEQETALYVDVTVDGVVQETLGPFTKVDGLGWPTN